MDPEPTVFVVDDDAGVVRELTRLLSTIGLRSLSFRSADEFFQSCPAGPGCLLLDVRMPGMSGLELQERLVNNGKTLPVIFLTGHADVPMAVQAMKAGAFDFLEKPFRAQELCDKIQKAIRLDTQRWKQRRRAETLECRLARLTHGEREVLALVATGKTNVGMAQELNLSVRGVEARRSKMMRKLGVTSRVELLQLVGNLQYKDVA
jgi:FixJ family two-component response regulator